MNTATHTDTTVLQGNPVTKDWHAWLNTMPPGPHMLHVTGNVQVGNPGVDVFLYKIEPPNSKSATLNLELVLVQRPGIWPQHVVLKQARYDQVTKVEITTVDILSFATVIASIPVQIVS